jgi:phenylpropionate dioxygenase-like ring-hydroxylating dioxygenase large terminal subunit
MSAIASRESESLLAGGSDPEKFVVDEAWYPVFYLADLIKSKPTPFTLLGQDLVIWWDQKAQLWRAFSDRCPHRLARLSEGRIAEDGLLECPYHGWAFTGLGKCDRIPQQSEIGIAHQSERACARAYATAEMQGLLFIYAGEPANATKVKVPIIQVLEDRIEDRDPDWVCFGTFRDLPYDAATLLENVLDASHLPFTHHQSVGNRANAAPMDLEILESNKQGFRGFWAEGPRRGKLGSQETTFVAPNLMWHEIDSKVLGRTLTVVYATPTRKGECRVFARFPFKFAAKLPRIVIGLTPTWYSHLGQNAILEDDQIFLHHQERYLAEQAAAKDGNYAKAYFLATSADRYVTEFHRWLNKYQADPFPSQKLPPARPRAELLDRYHSHTVHCQSCSGALRNIQRIRLGLLIFAGIFLIGSNILLNIDLLDFDLFGIQLELILVAIAVLIWAGLGQLERRFYHGRVVPPRNLTEQTKRANQKS